MPLSKSISELTSNIKDRWNTYSTIENFSELDYDSFNSIPLTSTIQLPIYDPNEPPSYTTLQNMTPFLSQNMTPTLSFPITVPNTINSAVIPKRGRKPLSDEVLLQKAGNK